MDGVTAQITSDKIHYQTLNDRNNFFYYSAVILDFLIECLSSVVGENISTYNVNLVVIIFDDFRHKKVPRN